MGYDEGRYQAVQYQAKVFKFVTKDQWDMMETVIRQSNKVWGTRAPRHSLAGKKAGGS